MASTYSNLKIQLMATGENSATWGNVTNTNLGTAIEEAITGSADVAFSNANVTITLTDTNTSQTARNLRLNLTGSATTGYSLIVPSIEKAYIINNGTDGTVTVKNATGTGIAVPTGKTVWVFNNGTNVVDVVTHLTSLTLASPLPVSSGGTGSNLTTFCNLTTNVVGTLPTANGGTGLTTFSVATGSYTVGFTNGSANITGTGLPAVNSPVQFTTTGTLPTNFALATTYYVVSNTSGGTIVTVSATLGGTAIVAGSAGTGTHTMTTYPAANNALYSTSPSALTAGTLPVAAGGTGGTTAATARTSLGAAASGANTDITALNQDVTVTASGTIAANSIGYRGLPQSTNTTLALADAGKHIYVGSNITIPANSSVAFPVGTTIAIANSGSSTLTISITTDTLRQAGTTSTGTRTLLAYGVATIVKVTSTVWYISGNVT